MEARVLPLDRQNALRAQYGRQHPGWLPATERYALLVREHLAASERLLDVGCGRGGLVEQLAHPLAHTIGLDPDQRSLREHRLPGLPRVAAHSAALPFSAGAFGIVTASWVLEHLTTPAADLAEIARVLRPGGVFVFVTPNRRHPLIQLNRPLSRLAALQRRLVRGLYGRAESDTYPAHYRANTGRDLNRLAAAAGMTLTYLDHVTDPTYWAAVPGLYRLLAPVEARLPAKLRLHLVGVMAR
jgi:SAM-dependent methyltransferase